MSELRLALVLREPVDQTMFYHNVMVVANTGEYISMHREAFTVSVYGFFNHNYDKKYNSIIEQHTAQEQALKRHAEYVDQLSRALNNACLWVQQMQSMVNGFEHPLVDCGEFSVGSVREKSGKGIYFSAYQLKNIYRLEDECRKVIGDFFDGLNDLMESRQITYNTESVATGDYYISLRETKPFDLFSQYMKIKQAEQEKKNRLRVVK